MAKLRSSKDICLYCFGDLDENRVCLSCGKRSDDTPNQPHQLAKRSMLNKRYLMGRVIGEGGFGITYFAWDSLKKQRVAIKEYYPSGYVSRDPRSSRVIINSRANHAASNRGLKRFIEEAQNLSKLKNLSGIVSVSDFFALNDTAYIVMEYLDGISLKSYIHRKGKLSAANALTILKPVIYSLEAVHEQGLIHRDISPDNILLTRDGEVKLIDFGASKHANPDGQSVSIVLKQGFAPEEQYRLHGEQGPWTDIYAMAVTIYFCITGQLPPESIQRMYEDTMLPPSRLGARIGKRTEEALMKALAVFARDRFRDIPSFADALYSALSDEDESQTEAPSDEVDEAGCSSTDPTSEHVFGEIDKAMPKAPNAPVKKEVPSDFPRRKTAIKRKFSAEALRTRLLPGEKAALGRRDTAVKEPQNGARTAKNERKYADYAEALRKKLL